jgi:hypothetical protein
MKGLAHRRKEGCGGRYYILIVSKLGMPTPSPHALAWGEPLRWHFGSEKDGHANGIPLQGVVRNGKEVSEEVVEKLEEVLLPASVSLEGV